VNVPTNVAALFHYRVGNDSKGSPEKTVRDYEMFKYSEDLASSPVTQALLPLARRKRGEAYGQGPRRKGRGAVEEGGVERGFRPWGVYRW
jgi:hypothetical protein